MITETTSLKVTIALLVSETFQNRSLFRSIRDQVTLLDRIPRRQRRVISKLESIIENVDALNS